MIDTVKLDGRTFILGEAKTIGLKNIRLAVEAALVGVTATVTIYTDTGAQQLGATNMTMAGTGTAFNSASYLLVTGAGGTIGTAGTYRAVYTVTYGTLVQSWEQVIQVLSNPY